MTHNADDMLHDLTRCFLDMEAAVANWASCLDFLEAADIAPILAQLEAPGGPAYLARMAESIREHVAGPSPEERRSFFRVVPGNENGERR